MPALYRPLDTETQIRVLELLPGGPDSPVHGKLQHIDLNAKPHLSYEALSYTWGTNIDEQPIELNGEKIPIRRNLWNFLTRLRATLTTSKYVWVDAICISQQDNAEKARQVQMIGRIFRQAKRVLAWVGEHADGSEALFKPWPTRRQQAGAMVGDATEDALRKRSRIWTAFLTRPYWNRTWITQEIGVARKIIVKCGADSKS